MAEFDISALSRGQSKQTTPAKRGRGRPKKPKVADVVDAIVGSDKDEKENEKAAALNKLKRKVDMYEQAFPQHKYGRRCNTYEDYEAAYAHYKDAIGEEYKASGFQALLKSILSGIEMAGWVMLTNYPSSPMSPMFASVSGITKAYDENSELFEDELVELRIEYPWLVPGGLFPRLMYKVAKLMQIAQTDKVEQMKKRLAAMAPEGSKSK